MPKKNDSVRFGFDLGTRSGWASCPETWDGNAARVQLGTLDLRSRRYEGGGMRYVRFRAALTTLFDAYRVTAVYFEEVRRHLGTDAAHVYGGLMAQLTAECELRKIPYAGIPVGTVKRCATGRGNAPKDAMMAAAKEALGYEPESEDAADAYWVLRAAMAGLA